MQNKNYFLLRKNLTPKIYAYSDSNPELDGLIKIGYTTGNVLERVKQQYPTSRPGKIPFKILLDEYTIKGMELLLRIKTYISFYQQKVFLIQMENGLDVLQN